MATIVSSLGKVINTRDIPDYFDPLFCCKCGGRIGWNDTRITDDSVARCDDCVTEED